MAEAPRHEEATGSPVAAIDPSLLELRRIRRLLFLSFLLAAFTAVYFAREVLLPVVLALVLTLTLLPVIRWGERLGIPRGVTALALMAAVATGLFLASYVLSGPVAQLAGDAPRIAAALRDDLGNVMARLSSLREATAEVAAEVTGGVAGGVAGGAAAAPAAGGPEVIAVVEGGGGLVAAIAASAASATGSVAAALLLTLFLLASGDFYHRRIVEAAPRLTDKKKALTIIRDVERQISRYLASITVVNAGLGSAVAAALWALGMPMPAVWGALAFLLNYIPFVGNLLNVALVAAVALVSYDTLLGALLPPLALVALMLLEANVVTPLVVGRRLALNLVSQLIMVAFWTWLWGIAGAILAVPFLVVVKSVCDRIESLRVLGSFLSSEPSIKPDEPPGRASIVPVRDDAHPATPLAPARAAGQGSGDASGRPARPACQ
jgi:predicted PurR-regulated permease PerM